MYLFNEYKILFKVYVTNGTASRLFEGVGKHINLSPLRKYVVGIDQATKKTGMFIKSVDDPAGVPQSVFMLDIVNSGLPNKETYFSMLKSMLILMFEGINVKEVYIEVPVENSATVYTRSRLEEMKGMINTLQIEVPSFRSAEFISVPPTVWRKHFLADNRYKGRRTKTELVKDAAMEEGLIRYPKMREYANLWTNPPDSFDAMGIAEGGAPEMFYDKGHFVKRVSSFMRATKKKYRYSYEVVEKSIEDDDLMDVVYQVICDELDKEWDDAIDYAEGRGTEIFVCDNIKNGEEFDDVISKVVSSTDSICIIVYKFNNSRKDDLLKWSCDVEKGYDETVICVCWADNMSKNKQGKVSWLSIPEIYDEDLMDDMSDMFGEEY